MSIQRGFSLVEMLVAVTVLSLLMVMLFGFFDQATKAWQNSEKKIDAFREVRAALFFIQRDIQQIFVSTKVPWYLYGDPRSGEAVNLVTDTGNSPPASYGDVIFFFSSQSPEYQEVGKNKSNLCAVGYYLSYRPDLGSGGRRSYKLYRYFKSSDDAWSSAGRGLLPFLTSGSSLFVSATTNDEVIARNVIGLEIRPLVYTRDSAGQLAIDGPGTGTDWNDYSYTEPVSGRARGGRNDLPDLMEISLNAFNYDTAAKLSDQDAWHRESNPDTWSPLGSQNIQTFRTRVSLAR
ncbi:MAG: prepilin-type N-terminal cleavage/methylation domain-containing protein [Candidatus Methylacidiphilales bacterium]|nr:prepilin-type N-terminal cleavage/methylation domain-containing protein [Candidatus Methylacidiphilales bacterium]